MAVIMGAIAAGSATTALVIVYDASVERQRERLVEMADSRARLLESVAKANMAAGGDVAAAALSQIREVHERFGRTGEFAVARREGDRIVFLLGPPFPGSPASIPSTSALAEPMRRALAGESGTVAGPDYRGETVLAAFEPVGVLGLGIVAKIDLAEISAPYIRAALASLGIALALIIAGCLLFSRIGSPLLRQLQNSKAALSKAEAIAHLGSWSYRFGDGHLEWSDETYRIFGLEPGSAQITFDKLRSLIHPDDWAQFDPVPRTMTNAHPGDGMSSVEYRLIRPDGSLRFIAAEAEVEFDHDGRPLRAIGAVQDVTARKRAETTLRQSEERFRNMFENAPIGAAIVDLNGRPLQVNRSLVRFLGYSSDELCRMTFAEFTHPEDVEADVGLFEELVAGRRETYQMEKRYLHAGGRIVWGKLSVSLVRKPSGEPGFLIGMVEDIDEHKRTTQVLAESEERYRTIFNVSQSAFLIYDLDGRLVDFNTAACLMHGYDREEMLGMHGGDFIHQDSRDEFAAFIDAIRLDERSWQSMGKKRRKDGTTFYVLMRGSPYHDHGRKLALSTLMDVTALKQAEEELRNLTQELELRVQQRTAELQAANHELEAFSYSVSHDLRAPLRHVEAYSLLVLNDYADVLNERGRHFLRRIQAGAQKMTDLIEALLRLSRITRTELRRGPVDLSRVARDIAKTLRYSAAERPAEFIIPSGIVADGDEGLLHLLLQNLMDNAWKFTRKSLSAARIQFGTETSGDAPGYFVRDNGTGFAMDKTDRLFVPFQRLHNAAEFEGTGIGLATVKRIVDKHGGRVWAESEAGKGATFHFTLGEKRPAPERS